MALEGSNRPSPIVKDTDPPDVKKTERRQDAHPHTYWAQLKGHTSHLTAAESLTAAMHYSIAKQLNKWPNPELDPSHLITEKEFDAAIAQARKL